MRISILQDRLAWGVNLVSKYTSNKGQLPILANILITAEKTGVTLTATNLETGIRVNIGGKVDIEGSTTVPAKNFAEFISSLPLSSVELSFKDEKIKIKSGSSQATLSTISSTEFPLVPNLSGEPIKIDGVLIKQVAYEVAFAAATDESRPVLAGVRFAKTDKKLIVVATDGFRLSRKEILSTENFSLSTVLILPSHTIQDLARVVEDGDVSMYLMAQNNQVIFDTGKTQIISRILEGNFPDVDKIIPKDFRTQVVVDRTELLRAVRAASIFARESNNIVKFIIHTSEFKILATGGQTGESESIVEAEVTGDELQISFNYKYVVDFLNSQSCERIIMKFNESTTPAVFVPEKDESLIHLIMPVRV
ncbi:MAG: DNA polymerase III subunit beta [Candidatus Amesbacteria bacterium]|nr:DNA polymerase III subunit beta [Candidatus Amesbacteria bacterium]